jgi:hypothetical protein
MIAEPERGNVKFEIRNSKYEKGASGLVRGGYWVGYTLGNVQKTKSGCGEAEDARPAVKKQN